ncbi:helix-turn-helix domain-containing protein [Haloarcula sp. S1CR25-12]|uniref:Helix-turn-helix domain-containing protein n=1 Tax=Haloarcula saliterrae TaxID=2950534 RepID=A0ABU2FDR2_9EURY|nr:helix-turn-helix domain-containing protein [Haloarcula sp. S1CR25-12]MDS0259951.1 helix-turn-helix domain-containing protein [Haloarcula sp. S1CR25-12]
MSVIAHLRVHANSFELGRILDISSGSSIVLENLVPLGEQAVPFFSIFGTDESQAFREAVQDHPSVRDIQEVSSHDDRTLFALDWDVTEDRLFRGIHETNANLLSATGGPQTWEIELRFHSHESLGSFKAYCSDANITLEVGRIYNPTRPESGPFYGLTQRQRDTLVRAVQGGYYSLPRELSTQDLADEFGISDQAVTERLRRAIVALVDNSLVAAIEAQDEFDPSGREL